MANTPLPPLPARPTASYRSPFQDNDRSSTISSVSTPYSQSNSASQIFEETSFFNQVSSNDSLSRGQQQIRLEKYNEEESTGRTEYVASSFGQDQGRYGLGFMSGNHGSSTRYDESSHNDIRSRDDGDHDDVDDEDAQTDLGDDTSSPDESGPLSEQIKQLHLEDVLAFLPIGGGSASGVFQRPITEDGYQRRTASGDKMPFQLDDELANLGTRALEEILEHDGVDEDEGHKVRGIRFQDAMGPNRTRATGRDGESKISPERPGVNSRKSSAQNSVGSSYSDLSDSSVTQSAMEDAYLSGFNNSKM
ncbi:hypothetical protein BGX28_000512 [Mortierella sp. GBA30]|nr:hypothetical protein BGX28_000512 [Mortierella sp. GBA30]